MSTGDREYDQIQKSLEALWCGPLRLEKIDMRLRATDRPVALQKGRFGEDPLAAYLPRPLIPFGPSVAIASVLDMSLPQYISPVRADVLRQRTADMHACAAVCPMDNLLLYVQRFASAHPDDPWTIKTHADHVELVLLRRHLRYYPVKRLLDVFDLCEEPYRVAVVYHQQESFYLFVSKIKAVRDKIGRLPLGSASNKET